VIQKPESQRYTEKAREIMTRRHIPALAVITMNADKIVSAEVLGTRVQGTDNMATLDDFFHIGSCGKSVLAVTAGKLVESGKIDWHTRLFDALPELEAKAEAGYANITLNDLLSCRAGIAAYTSASEQFPELNPLLPNVRMEFAGYVLSLVPVVPPFADGRFAHHYSNASYTLAALMLEQAAGYDWETMMLQTLIDGYGLDVRFGWPNLEEPELQPWGHSLTEDSRMRFHPPGDPYALSDILAPAGDISMRPLHYARYVQQHLRGLRGIDGYVSASTMRHIHHAERGYSLGVTNATYYDKAVSQIEGSAGTFYCHSIIVPGDDFAYVVMTNAGGSGVTAGVYELSGYIMKQHFRWWWKFWL
jgi:CubicO group peptidase (beta-lactamase class C family)